MEGLATAMVSKLVSYSANTFEEYQYCSVKVDSPSYGRGFVRSQTNESNECNPCNSGADIVLTPLHHRTKLN